VTTATGTVEDRNPATLAADQSVEGAGGPSLHHANRFFRRAVEAAIALAILLVIIAVIVAIVVARRRPHRPAAM
jgi:hypothetical protein